MQIFSPYFTSVFARINELRNQAKDSGAKNKPDAKGLYPKTSWV